jgi:amidophosphoribosyltransferase
MRVLLQRIRNEGQAREIHVRVACPPIVAPCFYGIDMSRLDELFAPRFLDGAAPTKAVLREMAADLAADSLRYLPIDAVARAIGLPAENLCQACITGSYPTVHGQRLYQIAVDNLARGNCSGRTYEYAATTGEPQR